MKKIAVMLLTFYAASMLSYGSLEIAHDLLHWLADHYHTHLHEHEHDHHHTFHDHEHSHGSHNHITENDVDGAEQTDLPILIHFFLYYQSQPAFQFLVSFTGIIGTNEAFPLKHVYLNPDTPPPQA
ncbi:MAG TPA: hypothetical protein VIN08_11640 [Ohtaekwangia sp.]|uniref:hypothetical protein n=1 Tax=Ohtaekwangia sp. TaxID=2066019 RepID=UPI002F92760C